MNEKERLRQLIVDKAGEFFFKYGFVATTTQQIAVELGISKKTIYRLFPSKENILAAIMERQDRDMEERLRKLTGDSDLDFFAKLKGITEAMAISHQEWSPLFIRDLQKMNLKEYKSCQKAQQQFLLHIEALLQEGVRKGIYRSDLNIPIVMLIANAVQEKLEFETLANLQLSLLGTVEAIIRIINEGILSETVRENYFSTIIKG